MRVLIVTSEWPTDKEPHRAMFVVRQVEALRRRGLDIDVFPFRGGGNPLRYIMLSRELHRRIARGGYDLVHAQWGQSALLALPKRLPLVITYRGSDLEGVVGTDRTYTLQGKVLRSASRFVARFADEIILVSESLARHLPVSRYSVVPSGVDFARFHPVPREQARAELGLEQDTFLALFAANPSEPIKQHWLADDAMRIAVSQIPRARLVVVTGAPFELMPAYMNACDALLMTSAHEGSPNVVKEALACDLPVVATDVGDVRVRIGSVDGCHVCPQGDAHALAEALLAVYRRGARIHGRETVHDLDEDLIAARVHEVYRRAVSSAEQETGDQRHSVPGS